MKQKQTAFESIETILHMTISSNLSYCTNIYDKIGVNDSSDLGDRMLNIVLNTVSDDTLVLITIWDILQLEKMREKIGKN